MLHVKSVLAASRHRKGGPVAISNDRGPTTACRVQKRLLPRLVVKEITDNGLDSGAEVKIRSLPESGTYIIEEDGKVSTARKDTARLFSINRPMVSTKQLRRTA